MSKTVMRNILRIDEKKCNGCGLCVKACVEGAIEILDGKARLVHESYCDGLGACIGNCPQDALIIEYREAPDLDPGKSRSRRRNQADPGDYPAGAEDHR